MAKSPARLSDQTSHSSHGQGTVVVTDASTTTFEGLPPACEGDLMQYSGDKPPKENTYFCVRNKHFRNWREKVGKGGDMLVFSNGQSFKPTTNQLFEGIQETNLQFVI